MTRRDLAITQRLKVWKLLELGLYPIPVNPASRKPLVAWGELDQLGYRPVSARTSATTRLSSSGGTAGQPPGPPS